MIGEISDGEPGGGAADAALGVFGLGAQEGEGEVDAFDLTGPAFELATAPIAGVLWTVQSASWIRCCGAWPSISNGGERWDATKLGTQLETDLFCTALRPALLSLARNGPRWRAQCTGDT